MTWTRLDDAWTDLPTLAGLSLAARWHYLCLIQFCSRSGNYDGKVRVVDALRCSDVDEPKAALNEIHRAGLVARAEDAKALHVVFIDDHVPPESVRDKTTRDRERKERSRRHASGDHALCYRQRCEFGLLDEPKPKRPSALSDMSPVSSHVMSHVTPGQDGTGRDGTGAIRGNEPKPDSVSTKCSWCNRDDEQRRASPLTSCAKCQPEQINQRVDPNTGELLDFTQPAVDDPWTRERRQVKCLQCGDWVGTDRVDQGIEVCVACARGERRAS